MPSYSPLYRVFPWVEDARPGEPGHPLYTPSPQGHGRIDNPEHYLALYASDDPDGAIGEAFGNHSVWTSDLLEGPPGLPGSRRALATIDASTLAVVDLDDAAALLDRGLRPSQVVTRDREITQAWALAIFRAGRWGGVRWWSYYEPTWGSFGLWDASNLEIADVTSLADLMPRVQGVAARMFRPWHD